MRVLVLNSGSSTLKGSLVASGAESLASAVVEWPQGEEAAAVVRRVIEQVSQQADAVGYRVVHGGSAYRGPTLVDAELLGAVGALDALAPLHNRRSADVMRAAIELIPNVPHVACFDTAFHADMPEHAWRYALPADWVGRWPIRRFGFHGLSVTWSIQRAAEMLRRPTSELRLVVAHLGAGCSVTAVEGGISAATSMGFTPLEGPMMATRSGSVDPGILLHLMDEGMSPKELGDGLSHRSGLHALTGTGDVREIERRAEGGDPSAMLALAMFAHQAAAATAGVATALPAVDALIFTGGIGEHSAMIRAAIADRLAVLAVPRQLETVAADGIAADGPPAVLVVKAREDRVIADEVAATIAIA